MIKLLVGLGNPGTQYANTRHNIGFMVIDAVASALEASWKHQSKFKAETAEVTLEGQKIILAKPQTMMNASGESVQRLAQFYKIAPENICVIYDDVDVPFGKLRFRLGGGSGQQGARSITTHLGPNFIRARMGISLNDRAIEPSEVYVLKPFTLSEQEQLPGIIFKASEVITQALPQEDIDEVTHNLT